MENRAPRKAAGRRRSPKWPWLVGALVVVFIAGAAVGWVLFLSDRPSAPRPEDVAGLAAVDATSTSPVAPSQDLTDQADVPKVPTEVTVTAEEVMADLVALNEIPTDDPASGESSAGGATQPAVALPDPLDGSLAPATAAGMTRIGPASVTDTSVTADYRGPDGGPVDVLRLSIVRYASRGEADSAVAAGFEEFPTARITFDVGGRTVEQGATQEDAPEQFPPALMLVWRQGADVMTVMIAPSAPGSSSAARALALEFIGALPY
jgi:hypothetical protein